MRVPTSFLTTFYLAVTFTFYLLTLKSNQEYQSAHFVPQVHPTSGEISLSGL